MIEGYITIKEAADKWGVSRRRVQEMCSTGRINGANKFGSVWAIPKDAEKPFDNRITSGKYKNWRNAKNNSSRIS